MIKPFNAMTLQQLQLYWKGRYFIKICCSFTILNYKTKICIFQMSEYSNRMQFSLRKWWITKRDICKRHLDINDIWIVCKWNWFLRWCKIGCFITCYWTLKIDIKVCHLDIFIISGFKFNILVTIWNKTICL